MRHHVLLALVTSAVLVAAAAGAGYAGDIVTVPTANQLRAGEVDVAAYYLGLKDLPFEFVRVQTLYVGLTDKIELDAHRYDIDVVGDETVWNATVVLRQEDEKGPIVVLGGRDLSQAYGQHASYHLSAAKTLNPPVGGPPTEPIVRLHLSVGTEDNTLLGEPRHEGLFGGVQAIVRPVSPMIGLVGLYDGQDIITGVTVVPEPGWPTIKAGTFGDHWWVGVNYTFNTPQ
jgi:hypothetical protein